MKQRSLCTNRRSECGQPGPRELLRTNSRTWLSALLGALSQSCRTPAKHGLFSFIPGLFAWAVLCGGCTKQAESQSSAPPEVTVIRAEERPVTDHLEFTGLAAASRTVNLVARVGGYLESVNFQDGAWVDEGQLLFVIEPAPYKANLALAQAQLTQAESEYERQQGLIKQNATSTAALEKWRSQRDQAAAQVELAKINLGYTRVTAPFAGRIGQHLVDAGNLVGPGGVTKLATIEQLTPIYVNFTVNEREALRVRRLLRSRGVVPAANRREVPVQVELSDEAGFPHAGVLDFVDSRMNDSTGALALRADLSNEDRTLFPGLFARIRVPLGKPVAMPVVPEIAIGNDQAGDYVWVVGADLKANRVAVEKGALIPEGRALRSGVKPGDQVIVRGLQRVRAGTLVNPATAPSNQP